jgi:hypothetical protein
MKKEEEKIKNCQYPIFQTGESLLLLFPNSFSPSSVQFPRCCCCSFLLPFPLIIPFLWPTWNIPVGRSFGAAATPNALAKQFESRRLPADGGGAKRTLALALASAHSWPGDVDSR